MQKQSEQKPFKVTLVVPSESGEDTREVTVRASNPDVAKNRALKRVGTAIRVKAVDPV